MLENRLGVLITRPQPDAAETAKSVAARGFDPVIAPVLTLLLDHVAVEGSFDAVVVTSRNALAGLPEPLKRLTLLAVGTATAARARAAGFATVLDAAGDAAALAALARQRLPEGSRLLFAHGAGQGDGLAALLCQAGFRVTRRAAYAVIPVAAFPDAAQEAMLTDRLRSAMFLSAETARAFVRLLPTRLVPRLGGIAAVAIGREAGEILAPLPWQGVRVSVRPTLDEVLALL